jgi:hypothetical protein
MMIVSLLRLVLEPIMFGMIGVTIGAFVPFRSTAKTASVAMVGFYFLLMIMLQQLNLGYAIGAMQAVQEATEATVHVAQTRFMWAMVQTVVVDIVLPLALPYVMTRGLIRIVRHHVESL